MIFFLGVFGVLWLWVCMNKFGFGVWLNYGKCILVFEVIVVLFVDWVMIIKVDE